MDLSYEVGQEIHICLPLSICKYIHNTSLYWDFSMRVVSYYSMYKYSIYYILSLPCAYLSSLYIFIKANNKTRRAEHLSTHCLYSSSPSGLESVWLITVASSKEQLKQNRLERDTLAADKWARERENEDEAKVKHTQVKVRMCTAPSKETQPQR